MLKESCSRQTKSQPDREGKCTTTSISIICETSMLTNIHTDRSGFGLEPSAATRSPESPSPAQSADHWQRRLDDIFGQL